MQQGAETAFSVTGLSKGYDVDGDFRLVVHNCDFTLEPGQINVMIGPSGCGKSTLIRLLAGFEPPTAGSLDFQSCLAGRPSRDILVLFQETALFPWMNTYENVVYGPKARGEFSKETAAFAERLLLKVGLSEFRDKYPGQLSVGMQRRAAIARAMINSPKLMILDEPFRGLDALTKQLMWDYYASLFADSDRTDLFVTTDIDEALVLADRILVMTNRPTRVRATLHVGVPRPRDLTDPAISERLNQVKRLALDFLHEEALKSFRTPVQDNATASTAAVAAHA